MTTEALTTTIEFEPCTGFQPSDHDDFVCRCGWLEPDHAPATLAVVVPVRAARRPRVRMPERRAS